MDMRIIHTVEELAECVALVDAAVGADRHSAMYGFDLRLDISRLNGIDPFSDDYKRMVLELYKVVHNQSYDTTSESNVLEYDVNCPAPFSSRSPAVVGSHFGAIATILRDFPALPPARVLDVGVGWGHTSILLAQTGFDVDALDINAGYLKLVDQQAKRLELSRIRTMNVQFEDIGGLTEKYDAILFFESFHHSLNHAKLIEDCKAILAPNGAIVLAGEPIFKDWPVPWSIRWDSLSAYCIHKFGWMELGFNEEYLLELLFRHGFYAERREYVDHPVANGYVARRAVGLILMTQLLLPRSYADTWNPPEGGGSPARWTTALSKLPGSLVGTSGFVFHMANYKKQEIEFSIQGDGEVLNVERLSPGESRSIEVKAYRPFRDITIASESGGSVESGPGGDRILGVAVTAIVIPVAI